MTRRYCAYPLCKNIVESGYCELHRKIKRYCAHSGCKVLVCDGSNYCAEHNPRRLSSIRRGTAKERGYDKKWEKLSKAYLNQYPMCEECLKLGIVRKADLVHHIKPIRAGGARLDWNNLKAVCTSCHGRIHSELGKPADNEAFQSQKLKTTYPFV